MTDDDTRQTVEETRTGYHVEIKSKRGIRTYDYDKVILDYWSQERPDEDTLESLTDDVEQLLDSRREHQPDVEDDDE